MMPSSMTGFASAEIATDLYSLVWEARSVNHRFLDISLRLPEELRKLEPRCKEHISAAIRRGKVDCSLRVTRAAAGGLAVRLNATAVESLLELQSTVRGHSPESAPLTTGEILRWPGVVEEPALVPEDLEQAVLDGLAAVLATLKESRQREGERLAEGLAQRCAGITAIVAEITPQLGDMEQRYRSKLMERMGRLDLELNPERLEQEVALIAQRLDVAEELDRLASHVQEVEATMQKDEAIGRRLDFVIQELNREANTFASKIQDEELARRGVELKVLIEQMREQVQNLE